MDWVQSSSAIHPPRVLQTPAAAMMFQRQAFSSFQRTWAHGGAPVFVGIAMLLTVRMPCRQLGTLQKLPHRQLCRPCRYIAPHAQGLSVDSGAGQPPLTGSTSSTSFGQGPISAIDQPLKHWELQIHGLVVVMISMEYVTSAELQEETQALAYADWGYYERWGVALAKVLLRKGLLDVPDLGRALGVYNTTECQDCEFDIGERVWVKQSWPGQPSSMWRRPHLSVPGKLEALEGKVVHKLGMRSDPNFFKFFEDLGFTGAKNSEHCYSVEFSPKTRTICIEVFQSWLQREVSSSSGDIPSTGTAKPLKSPVKAPKRRSLKQTLKTMVQDMHDASAMQVLQLPQSPAQRHQDEDRSRPGGPGRPSRPMSHEDHDHSDHSDHSHLSRAEVEQAAVDKEGCEVPGQRLAEALLENLVHKGLIAGTAVARAIEVIESLGLQPLGPRVVARAWLDENFKRQLLEDANAAIQALDEANSANSNHVKVKVVESTEKVHNLVVCTLCSCYPVSLLGLSPSWYKSREYRIQAVERPKELLKESFGLEIPSDVDVQVHDSNSELRNVVLPRRPAATEGWSEEELIALVTRDTMIGVAIPEA